MGVYVCILKMSIDLFVRKSGEGLGGFKITYDPQSKPRNGPRKTDRQEVRCGTVPLHAAHLEDEQMW